MKLKSRWAEKMRFNAEAGSHQVGMDTTPPIGNDTAPSPKQLLLSAICGCTGMDVIALLKKYKQPVESFEIEADAEITTDGHPVVFRKVDLTFLFKGAMDREKVMEAVRLSQTKYCSVSAMVSKACPIHYTVQLNAETVGSGTAEFPKKEETT